MPVLQRIRKPTTRRGKRFLLSREPKVIENTKRTLFVKGKKCGDVGIKVLQDFHKLKRPNAVMLSEKNDILPFDDATFFERQGRKKEANLFCFVSHTKKRPNNLVIGRMHDYQMLDMAELGIERYTSLEDFKIEKIDMGVKPCLVFNGEIWSQNHEYKRLQNLFVDLFYRERAKAVRLQGLEHVMSFSAINGVIYLRSYKVQLKKSGQRTPRVELVEIGPSADMKLKRSKLASDDLFKLACKKPGVLKIKKKKGISKDGLGNTHGRIHVPKQEIQKLQTRKMKGLKKSVSERREERAALRKRQAEFTGRDAISMKRLRSDDS